MPLREGLKKVTVTTMAAAWIKEVSATYLDYALADFDLMSSRRGVLEADGAALDSFVGNSKAGTSLYVYTVLV